MHLPRGGAATPQLGDWTCCTRAGENSGTAFPALVQTDKCWLPDQAQTFTTISRPLGDMDCLIYLSSCLTANRGSEPDDL